jgi:hypothetical protein
MISSLRSLIGENQMMAYLVMMTVRLVELHTAGTSAGRAAVGWFAPGAPPGGVAVVSFL